MAFADYRAKFINSFLGRDVGVDYQLSIAKLFKKGLGIAIWITLIYGFCGYAGVELGMVFVTTFATGYGVLSIKWLCTPEGKLCVDQRLTEAHQREVLIARFYPLFITFVVIGVMVVLLAPMLILQNAFGVWVSAILIMTTPGAVWNRHRKAV